MDIITFAMAKAYTDEKFAEGAPLRAINLAKYSLTDDDGVGYNLADKVFELFANGGGSFVGKDDAGFADSIGVMPTAFLIPLYELNINVIAFVNCRITDGEYKSGTIEASFLTDYTGSMVRATIVFGLATDNQVIVTVAVEPLTIPET